MKNFILISSLVLLTGCAGLVDAPRNIWGSSNRELQQARSSSVYQSYDLTKSQLFDEVLVFAQEKGYYVFSQERSSGVIVLMEIPGVVNTTEVGVFIVSQLKASTRVELSSRSTLAKKIVAQHLFPYLSEAYNK